MNRILETKLVFVSSTWWCHYQAAVTEEDKEHMITGLQKKVTFLERWLYKNLSEDENLQELLKEVSEKPTSQVISVR